MAGVNKQVMRIQPADVDPTFDIDGPVILRQITVTGGTTDPGGVRINARISPDAVSRDVIARFRCRQNESIPIPMHCVTLYDFQIDSLDNGNVVLHFA